MRVVIVGEAPGGGVDISDRPQLALTGAVGKRMSQLARVPFTVFLKHTDRRNLFLKPEPQSGWDREEARMRADTMCLELRGRAVILLGAKVATAFGVEDWPIYEWGVHPAGFQALRLPHPSGRNRVLNSPRERERFGRVLRAALGREAW